MSSSIPLTADFDATPFREFCLKSKLSSDHETIEREDISLYRGRDLFSLRHELLARGARGHQVEEVLIPDGASPPDIFVYLPPYRGFSHLKLALEGYAVTSVGLVVTRGV